MIYSKLKNYWNIQKPTYLQHPQNWDGVSITPEHKAKQVLQPIELDEEIIVITPVHKGSIQRTFGDVLCDEVI